MAFLSTCERWEKVTTTGHIEDLKVPRDREGVFQTQAFEQYQRYEPEVAEALDADICEWDQHARHRKETSDES